MGTAKQGIYGPVHGKVGQVVWYELNGQAVARGIGHRSAARTAGEIQSSNTHNLLTSLFNRTKSFIKKGFSELAEGTVQNFHNLAMSYNRLHAVNSDPQNPTLLFDKLLFSNGHRLEPRNPIFEAVEYGVKFSWEYLDEDGNHRSDRAMMLAYFPEADQAIFETSGAKRNELSDVLLINNSLRTKTMHIYLAFGAIDSNDVSRSVYLGQLN